MAEIRLTTWYVKALQIMGEATYQLVSRISAINSSVPMDPIKIHQIIYRSSHGSVMGI